MEAVSAVKMRKSQEKAMLGRPYVHSALRILSQLSTSQDGLSHPLAQKRESGKTLLVIVTSDKGLAGSVNSAVLKRAEDIFARDGEVDVITIGRKAYEFAQRSQKTILAQYQNISDDVQLADVYDMTKVALDAYAADDSQYRHVKIAYQNFLSTFEQEPTVRTILPLDPAEIHFIMRGIRPKTGRGSEDVVAATEQTSYEVEPSAEEVLDILIPQLMQIITYHALIESKASEHSARRVAMKNATDKSKEVAKALTLEFNKARQAAITAEVSEITGGIEALK